MVKGVTVESIRCCISRSYPSPYISPAFFRVASSCEVVSKKREGGTKRSFLRFGFCFVLEACHGMLLGASAGPKL